MDLTEGDVKEEVARIYRTFQNDLHDPDNHNDMITHLEPDILNAKPSGPRKHHYEQS